MKKLLMSLLFVMVFCISALAGGIPNWTITPIDTSSWTAITIPQNNNCGDVTVYTSDGTDFKLAKDAAGTDEIPLPAGLTALGWSDICAKSSTNAVFYAQAEIGTPNLILLFTAN